MPCEESTATYKTICDAGGNRYKFYCDLSGALVCTTKAYRADTPEAERILAWKQEGRRNFNHCRRCGRYVIDAMFNAEVLECVACAPYETAANFCKTCGAKISAPVTVCPACGKPLYYEGGPG